LYDSLKQSYDNTITTTEYQTTTTTSTTTTIEDGTELSYSDYDVVTFSPRERSYTAPASCKDTVVLKSSRRKLNKGVY